MTVHSKMNFPTSTASNTITKPVVPEMGQAYRRTLLRNISLTIKPSSLHFCMPLKRGVGWKPFSRNKMGISGGLKRWPKRTSFVMHHLRGNPETGLEGFLKTPILKTLY